jgi:hypothetical protein
MKEQQGGSHKPDAFHSGAEPASRVLDFSKLHQSDIANGIEDCVITSPRAVEALVRKQLESERQTFRGEYLAEMEARYAPLIAGDKRRLAGYCQEKADRAMTFDYPVPSDSTNYAAAERWYQMAARFAEEAAKPHEGQQRDAFPQSSLPPDHPASAATRILNGVEDGIITDPDKVHDLTALLLETERQTLRGDLRAEREAANAELVYGAPKDMVQFCLAEATSRLGLDEPGSLHTDEAAAARWYQMAARFARRAQDQDDAGTTDANVSGD